VFLLFIFDYEVDKGVFAVGIDWKYRDAYPDEAPIDPKYRVYPHYKNLKEEQLNYKHLQFYQVKKIMIKAKEYHNTNIARSMKAGTYPEIYRRGDALSIDSLICMIMYCDYTDLSTDFTLSFRKSNPFQPLSQIKKHNSFYYHWSKILRQTIYDYGQSYRKGNGLLSKLRGPFYSGMSVVLTLSKFAMYINSPLSTSVHLEVAVKFADQEGMILEMDNNAGFSRAVRGMDVSWLSRYREEEERYV